MARYVALLRGINVGGHRVKMTELSRLFGELGYEHVETFIASGNVIFSADTADARELEREISAHLEAKLGFEVATFVRTPSELEAISAFPHKGDEERGHPPSAVYVVFLSERATDELGTRLASFPTPVDEFTVEGREVYWLTRGRISDSPVFAAGIGKVMGGVPNTARKLTTVRKLVAKYAG